MWTTLEFFFYFYHALIPRNLSFQETYPQKKMHATLSIGSRWCDCHARKNLAEGWGDGIITSWKIWKTGWQEGFSMIALSSWRKFRITGHLGWYSCMNSNGKWKWDIPSMAGRVLPPGRIVFPCSGSYYCPTMTSNTGCVSEYWIIQRYLKRQIIQCYTMSLLLNRAVDCLQR